MNCLDFISTYEMFAKIVLDPTCRSLLPEKMVVRSSSFEIEEIEWSWWYL